jgi:hypothetical protein
VAHTVSGIPFVWRRPGNNHMILHKMLEEKGLVWCP